MKQSRRLKNTGVGEVGEEEEQGGGMAGETRP